MESRRWNNVTKIIIASTLAVLAIILAITFRVLIGPTIVAFLLAFILSYPVNWIQRSTGWSRGPVVALVYVGLLSALTLMPVLDMLFQQAGEILGNLLVMATGNPLSLARGLTNSLITVVYVLVLNFWLLKDSYKLQRLVIAQIPIDYQEDARRLGQELGQIWHAFMRGQLALAVTVGILTWIPLTILGMPNAGGLALLAGVLEFLPSIGPAISGTVGTVSAFFLGSSWLPVNPLTFAVIIGLTYAIIGQLESIYLIPRLVGGRVRLHPAVTFVGIIAGAFVFGLLGILLATPILASARTILSYIYRKLLDQEPFEPLKATQAAVRIPGLIAGRKIDAILFDLDGALAPLDWRAADWAARHFTFLDRILRPEHRRRIMQRLMLHLEGIINLFVGQGHRFFSARAVDKALPWLDYLRGYAPTAELQPFPAVVPMLHTLSQNYQLALITTRGRADLDAFLRQADLSPDLFRGLISREETRTPLPHGDPLLLALELLQLPAGQVLMVSDTDSNLRSARALEMATAGVLSGLAQARDLSETDLVLTNSAELLEWLAPAPSNAYFPL
jgi:predicted PurR-regulated permease PerM/phosphoglycolate phosphatase-like HAD superfamily hydrolase